MFTPRLAAYAEHALARAGRRRATTLEEAFEAAAMRAASASALAAAATPGSVRPAGPTR
jgi:hypothetical protein